MRIAAGIIVSLAILAAGAIGFAYSGAYDIAAATPHSEPVWKALRIVMEHSVKRRARNLSVPELDDPEKVHRGFRSFQEMCVTCHGAPGAARSDIAKGLNPEAPDLAKTAGNWKPAELYWIVKHGIKMTGMPAWGPTHDDEALWALVAFLKVLPSLPSGEYQGAVAYHRLNETGRVASGPSGHH